MQEQNMDSLYKEYAKQVYKYLYSLCQSSEIAEELTQETFYQAIRSINKYNGSCKIYVWLCQIAKHLWYQELEKRNKTKTCDITNDTQSYDISIEEKALLYDEKLHLFKSLHLLDEPMREVIYLRLTGEFSFKEIGEILGKDETWARVNFYRGKQKMQKGRLK